MTESTAPLSGETPADSSLNDPAAWDVSVGRIKSTWDKAFLRVIAFADVPGRFDIGKKLAVQKPAPRILEIKKWRQKDNALILDVGIETSAEANALIGQEIYVHPTMRAPLDEDEFYLDEALGMMVVLDDGEELGEIEEILETSAHDVYVTPRAMIPVVPEFILSRDFDKRIITVKRWEGLLPE